MIEKLKMKCNDEDYGVCGKKAPFKDSNGDNLYTGDVVRLFNKKTNEDHGKCSIVEDEEKIFVMGIWSDCPYYQRDWNIYKEKSYMSMKEGDEICLIHYEKNEDKKEMTIPQIEKELGYSIKIVKE